MKKSKNSFSAVLGFSLLELLVVLVLLALVSATAIMRWSASLHRAVSASAIQQLEHIDQQIRTFARSHHRACSLEFKLGQSRVRKHYRLNQKKDPAWVSLGPNVKIKRVVLANSKRTSLKEVNFSPAGISPSYGILVLGPGKQKPVWLVFAGISGQMTRLESETQFNAALRLESKKTATRL